MMDDKQVIERAQVAASWVTTQRRADDTVFWRWKEGAPDWCTDLSWAAHEEGAMMPDDHVYRFMADALFSLADAESLDDARDGLEPDFVNHALVKWLGSHGWRPDIVDQACEEIGLEADNGIMNRIACGQLHELREVFERVVTWLSEEGEVING